MSTTMILAFAVAVGVLMIFIGLARTPSSNTALTVQQRLSVYGGEKQLTVEEIELQRPFSERVLRPGIERLGSLLSRSTPQKARQDLLNRLELAGRPGNLTPEDFAAVRLVAAAIVGAAGLLIGLLLANPVYLVISLVAGVILGYYLPVLWLKQKVDARKTEIQKALPDALDLLVICVDAGLGFDAALARVTDKYKNALSELLAKALREVSLGRPRRDGPQQRRRRRAQVHPGCDPVRAVRHRHRQDPAHPGRRDAAQTPPARAGTRRPGDPEDDAADGGLHLPDALDRAPRPRCADPDATEGVEEADAGRASPWRSGLGAPRTRGRGLRRAAGRAATVRKARGRTVHAVRPRLRPPGRQRVAAGHDRAGLLADGRTGPHSRSRRCQLSGGQAGARPGIPPCAGVPALDPDQGREARAGRAGARGHHRRRARDRHPRARRRRAQRGEAWGARARRQYLDRADRPGACPQEPAQGPLCETPLSPSQRRAPAWLVATIRPL